VLGRSLETRTPLAQTEFRLRVADGSIRWFEVRGEVNVDDRNQVSAITGVVRDVTERRQIEQEQLQIKKLESVGLLAGGIAHDFNNTLTGILGNISLARLDLNDTHPAQETLAEAERAAVRARDLTQQLLTFSKGGEPVKQTASIAEVIADSATFALRGASVAFELEAPPDLWDVDIDTGQMSQVFQNLVLNAKQASPDGGLIRIVARNVTADAAVRLPIKADRCLEILVIDQGIGIPGKHLQRIFDPYFTTKQTGSGLGLATVFSIIKKHGGFIEAESEVGVGTTFRILLPASEQRATRRSHVTDHTDHGSGRVLVMDDDEVIRGLASRILEKSGYSVRTAADGEEAINLYVQAQSNGEPFDIVILDLTVPGAMGGREALARLREINPDIKAIVSSGYSNDPVMAAFAEYGFSAVVAKPYNSKDLRQVVGQVMKGHQLSS